MGYPNILDQTKLNNNFDTSKIKIKKIKKITNQNQNYELF
jgi:hypothetical protein